MQLTIGDGFVDGFIYLIVRQVNKAIIVDYCYQLLGL